ncbi:MAG TPA: hypothetical protein VF126_13750, partial [Acidobacteriaceae bacterium]
MRCARTILSWLLALLGAAAALQPCTAQEGSAAALPNAPQAAGGGHATARSTAKPGEDDQPLTMFPHSETAPWFVAGQINI